jgi:hypothetical protein
MNGARCAGCGRELTDVESRLCGRSEECRGHIAALARGWDIEQDQWPGL